MNTLLFTLEYPPFRGGVANYYGNLIKHWPRQNNIFVLDNNSSQLINNQLPFFKWLPAVGRLAKSIKKNKINHILVGHILPLGILAYFLSKLFKIKYSVVLHGMDFTCALRKPRKKILTKTILKKSQNIICANSYVAKLVKEFIDSDHKDKVRVVNPGITLEQKNKKTLKQE